MDDVINMDDLKLLHECLPLSEVFKVKLTADLCLEFWTSKDKAGVVRRARDNALYLPIRGGISVPSLYRKCQLWRQSGSLLALADRRLLRGVSACGLAQNGEFVAFWQSLCCENKRKTAPARRKLFALLSSGERIPGLGDWRGIWALEHGGMQPDAGMACPYRAGIEEPRGWSTRNLAALAPSKFALRANRTGMMAATMDGVPEIKRTRRDLQPCQVVQLDDMWYEHKVAFAGNRHGQRVVEYAMVDVLTGHVINYLTKPVRERDDGTKETLRSKWTRYLIAHLLCEVGIPSDRRVLIMGEHGTASADGPLRAVLAELSGGHVEYDSVGRVRQVVDGTIRFGAGGLLSTPLGKGLYDGRPKGNPRYKGLLEGFHALIKNELGDVRGHMGGGRDVQPEYVYGMDKRDEQLRGLVRALEVERPGIMDRLQLPYIPYHDFRRLIDLAYDRLDARLEHRLEGWEECGFVCGEWRPTKDSPWMPWLPEKLTPKQVRAFKYLIDCGEIPYRTRRMSPGEAWNSRKGELVRMEPFVGPLVMGDELARLCSVTERLQMVYKDPETLAKCTVTAMLADGRTLERGKIYKVWVNPLAADHAYVADAGGRFLGIAPVQVEARYDDAAALEAQLGVRQAALAAERRRMRPVVVRQLREENARAAANVREIVGSDPVYTQAVRNAAAVELADRDSGEVCDAELMAEEPSPAPSIADDDFIV